MSTDFWTGFEKQSMLGGFAGMLRRSGTKKALTPPAPTLKKAPAPKSNMDQFQRNQTFANVTPRAKNYADL